MIVKSITRKDIVQCVDIEGSDCDCVEVLCKQCDNKILPKVDISLKDLQLISGTCRDCGTYNVWPVKIEA